MSIGKKLAHKADAIKGATNRFITIATKETS
jgi:hypothetical protein